MQGVEILIDPIEMVFPANFEIFEIGFIECWDL